MDENFPFAGYGLVAVGVLLTICKAESGEHAYAVVTYLIMHIVLFFGILQKNCHAVQAYAKFAMLVFIIHVAAIVIKTCEEVLKLKPLLSFEVLNLIFVRAVEVLFMYALLQLVIKITGDFVEKVGNQQKTDGASESKDEKPKSEKNGLPAGIKINCNDQGISANVGGGNGTTDIVIDVSDNTIGIATEPLLPNAASDK